jgi:hypothetical protein
MTAATPLLAGTLLALAELGFAFALRSGAPASEVLVRAICAGLGGVVVSALVLLAATPHVPRSLPMTIGGTATALVVVVVLSRAWRR